MRYKTSVIDDDPDMRQITTCRLQLILYCTVYERPNYNNIPNPEQYHIIICDNNVGVGLMGSEWVQQHPELMDFIIPTTGGDGYDLLFPEERILRKPSTQNEFARVVLDRVRACERQSLYRTIRESKRKG